MIPVVEIIAGLEQITVRPWYRKSELSKVHVSLFVKTIWSWSSVFSSLVIKFETIFWNSNPSYKIMFSTMDESVNEFFSKITSSCVGLWISNGFLVLKILHDARSYAVWSLAFSKIFFLISTSTGYISSINFASFSKFNSGTDGSSYRKIFDNFTN